MEKKLPVYKIKVDPNVLDETGCYAVSLVDNPAIETNWIKLSKEVEEIILSVQQDKQILYGPLLIPGKMIYRRYQNFEYYVVFEKEDIEIIANKFNKQQLTNKLNFMHSDIPVEGYISENWLTAAQDKSKELGFSDLPEGTWFAGVKVEDEKFWTQEIKTENVRGFSIEILAETELIEMSKANVKTNIKFMEVTTKNNEVLVIDGELVAGSMVTLNDTQAPAGDYELEDGTIITVDENGAIAEVKAAEVLDNEPVNNELALVPEEVLTIVQPILDELRQVIADLTTRVETLEAGAAPVDNTELTSQVTELTSQVTKLSSDLEELSNTPAVKSIKDKTEKVEKLAKTEESIVERLNAIKKARG